MDLSAVDTIDDTMQSTGKLGKCKSKKEASFFILRSSFSVEVTEIHLSTYHLSQTYLLYIKIGVIGMSYLQRELCRAVLVLQL